MPSGWPSSATCSSIPYATIVAAVLLAVLAAFAVSVSASGGGPGGPSLRAWWPAGSSGSSPRTTRPGARCRRIADASPTRAAQPTSSRAWRPGMVSTALPGRRVLRRDLVAYKTAGLYGIALAGLGMLATTGIPWRRRLRADRRQRRRHRRDGAPRAGGARRSPTRSTRCGNTTAAIGKGFAIGSAGADRAGAVRGLRRRRSASNQIDVDRIRT